MITRLLALTVTFALLSPAQAADEFVKVTAITQFVEGRVQKTEASGAKSDLVFQTPLYEGDRVDTAPDTTLKVTTRNGCIFVLRGDGAMVAPTLGKPWRLRAESLRVLCTGRSAPETFGVSNAPLIMKDGEVLVKNKQLMLVNGAASYMGVTLIPRRLYVVEGTELKEVTPQPNPADLRAFNISERPPKEGFDWPTIQAPKVEKVYTSRWMLGPVVGGDGVTYDNVDYAQGGLRGGGLRLQAQFKRKNDTGFLIALTSRESNKNTDQTYFGPPPAGVQNSIEFHTIEVGLRQSYDRWWSPFVRVGAGGAKAKIGYTGETGFGTQYSRYSYEFYILNATWGIDAHLTPRFLRPFGFYASAEATLYQSFHRGAREQLDNSIYYNYVPAEAWSMTGFDALGSFGLELNF